jgi:hypothetical protein
MCDKKCKNIECKELIEKKRIYCSLTCRNVYVNKYLRDYSKNIIGLSKSEEYDKNPKYCKCCINKISYEKRRNKFCNSSCQATFTNKIRVLSDNVREEANHKRREKLIKNTYVKCKSCQGDFLKKSKKLFCSDDCRKNFKRKDMDEFQKYKRDCVFKFNLSDYYKEFNFKLIEEFGWYKPANRGNNLDGVSRDHIYSIRDGFDNGIEPKLIAHPANCKLILQKQNSSKHKRSDITIEELENRIRNWKLKYND